MLLFSWLGSIYHLRKKKLPTMFMRGLIWFSFSGWLATLAGWYVTEIGRQPYIVSGVLRTSEAVTQVSQGNIVFSLSFYLITYFILLAAYIHTLFYMARKSVLVEEYETESSVIKDSDKQGPQPVLTSE